jgi:hypothetical protein
MTLGELIKLGELGKRGYDLLVTRGAPFYSDEFMRKHAQFMRSCIDLVPGIDALSPEKIDQSIHKLLSHVASVVKAYNNGEGIVVNSNYMIPRTPTVALRDQAIFTRKDRDPSSFQCFLTLERWANPDGACPTVVLPVERPISTDAMLFGAPKAFTLSRTQVVNDTLDMDMEIHEHETERIRRWIGDFFESQKDRMRSFASFPVIAPEGLAHCCPFPAIGVVNVDSNRKRLLGYHWSNQQKLGLALEPVIHTLSHFLVRRHFRRDETEA